MIGTTVGKYRIVDKLGRGGMGTVYKAVDQTLDREVAIKVLNPDLTDADVLKRFRAEAVTLARLNHAGIATIYELHHQQEDELLMVMEFVRGETFHDLSDRIGPLAPPQAAHLCMQVLDALGHAHRGGVVHRDLKPANLMITDTGTVKVMDFGIARVLGSEHFTHGGYMMGTPAYMAPEQVLGREIDGRADLYSVGVVLYRLLTGHLPFNADTAISMVQMQISEAPTPILNFRSDLPPWCVTIIDRALAKSPADRFQSAEEFRSALLAAVTPQALGEMPTIATPTPPGLTFDPEVTAPHRTPSMMRTAPPPKTSPSLPSAVTVSTPAATKVPCSRLRRGQSFRSRRRRHRFQKRRRRWCLAGITSWRLRGWPWSSRSELLFSRSPPYVAAVHRGARGDDGGVEAPPAAPPAATDSATPPADSSRQFRHDASGRIDAAGAGNTTGRAGEADSVGCRGRPAARLATQGVATAGAKPGARGTATGVSPLDLRGRPFDDSDR